MDQDENLPSDVNDRVSEFLSLLNATEVDMNAFLFSLVPNRLDVQDISQELRLRLWEQFDQYDPEKEFGAWARTIAVYLVMAYRKKNTRHSMLSLDEELLGNLADKFSISDKDHSRRRVAMDLCLEELNETRKNVLMEYYSGRKPLRKIATMLGTTYGALQRKIHRIRASLLDCVSKKLRKGEA